MIGLGNRNIFPIWKNGVIPEDIKDKVVSLKGNIDFISGIGLFFPAATGILVVRYHFMLKGYKPDFCSEE